MKCKQIDMRDGLAIAEYIPLLQMHHSFCRSGMYSAKCFYMNADAKTTHNTMDGEQGNTGAITEQSKGQAE